MSQGNIGGLPFLAQEEIRSELFVIRTIICADVVNLTQ